MYALNRSRIWWLGLAVGVGVCTQAASTAKAANVASQIQELFDTAWKPSSENFATAHQQYDLAKAAAPSDVRVPLAMALVSVKNFKNDEAAKYVDQAIPSAPPATSVAKKLDPLSLSARRLKIWLQVLRKDHAGAQASMHELAGMIGTEDAIAPSDEAKKTAEWLGGVLGYYAGPAAGQTSSVNADALQADLATQLKGALANTMADGKAAALKQFEQLQSAQAAARADIKTRLAAKRADDLKKNQSAQTALTEKINKLDSTKDAPDAKAGKNDPAEKERQRLQDQQTRLQQQLMMEMQRPRKNDQLIGRLNAQMTLLQQQIARVGTGNENAAQQEAAKKQAAEAEKKKLQSQAGTLEAKSKQLAGGSDDVVSTPVDAKLASINSYAPIDLEKEKQRILDSYATK